MQNHHERVIAVFGGSRPARHTPEYTEAYTVGKLLARAGFVVLNGGFAGTMEASARGARENGGRTIGVISGEFSWLTPNPFLDEVVMRDDLFARIREMHTRADGFVVLKGSMGTLAELAIVWNLAKINGDASKPIVLLGEWWNSILGSWREHLAVTEEETKLLQVVARPEQAIEQITRVLRQEHAPSPRAPSSAT
ncbi:MAG: LOG family protein [Chloroflexi bacterium]|nr:LOG family protein [Chloroflexota bacterium]